MGSERDSEFQVLEFPTQKKEEQKPHMHRGIHKICNKEFPFYVQLIITSAFADVAYMKKKLYAKILH